MREARYDLEHFSMTDMLACGAALRGLGRGAASMEEAAARVVQHLHERLVDVRRGRPACALVRCYKTHRFGALPEELRAVVGAAGASLSAEVRCLTLLASAGVEPAWNDRRTSSGHQVIPLPSEQVLQHIPMVAQLIHQLGMEINSLLAPQSALLLDSSRQRAFNVFHVAEAVGSPFIPAQEAFVIPHGIRSVVGFGSVLPPGELVVVIAFATVPISREAAELFKTLSLSVKLALLEFSAGPFFV